MNRLLSSSIILLVVTAIACNAQKASTNSESGKGLKDHYKNDENIKERVV